MVQAAQMQTVSRRYHARLRPPPYASLTSPEPSLTPLRANRALLIPNWSLCLFAASASRPSVLTGWRSYTLGLCSLVPSPGMNIREASLSLMPWTRIWVHIFTLKYTVYLKSYKSPSIRHHGDKRWDRPSNLRWDKGLRAKEMFPPEIILGDSVFSSLVSLPENQLLNYSSSQIRSFWEQSSWHVKLYQSWHYSWYQSRLVFII